MFEIGDKVVYPMHGGHNRGNRGKGNIRRKTAILYTQFPMGGMKVMIPTKNVEEIGVREVISHTDISKLVHVLSHPSDTLPDNWNKRYRMNLEKIKTGDIFEVADVVRDLMIRDRDKGLSSAEKKMLNNARQILISEVCLSTSAAEDEVASMIDKITLQETASD